MTAATADGSGDAHDPFEPEPAPPGIRRDGNAEDEARLMKRGWFKTGRGWRHPNLEWPWSIGDALRMEQEHDAGDARSTLLLETSTPRSR